MPQTPSAATTGCSSRPVGVRTYRTSPPSARRSITPARTSWFSLLWPEDTIAEAAPTLHKAVHFDRRAYEPPGRGGRTTIP